MEELLILFVMIVLSFVAGAEYGRDTERAVIAEFVKVETAGLAEARMAFLNVRTYLAKYL